VDQKTTRQLRQIAHHLHPVVIIGDGGASAAVIAETERALNDHELIKVRINVEDRNSRRQLSETLVNAVNAESVQAIGKVVVLFRSNPNANPQLSNLSRVKSSAVKSQAVKSPAAKS
jgi:RNA-binding protein